MASARSLPPARHGQQKRLRLQNEEKLIRRLEQPTWILAAGELKERVVANRLRTQSNAVPVIHLLTYNPWNVAARIGQHLKRYFCASNLSATPIVRSAAAALLAQSTSGEALELKQKLVAQKKGYQPVRVPTLQYILCGQYWRLH